MRPRYASARPAAWAVAFATALLLAGAPHATGQHARAEVGRQRVRPQPDAAGRTRLFKYLMGTSMRVEVYGGSEADRQAAATEAFAAIAEVDRIMSSYRPDSEISRMNAAASPGVVVSGPLFAVLEAGRRITSGSGGAFSLTAAAHDADALVLDAATRRVRLTRPVVVSVDGLAKGFAAELAAGSLTRRGLAGNIDTSGTQFMVGRPPGHSSWSVGIGDPRQPGNVLGAIDLTSGAVATVSSLSAPRDPRTGTVATAVLSATVVSADGTVADALSRALFVLGAQDGLPLLASYHGTWGVVASRAPDGSIAVAVSPGHDRAFHPARAARRADPRVGPGS